MHVEQLQLDEVYAALRALKAGKISDDKAIDRLERSPYWVWTAMDPQSKLHVPQFCPAPCEPTPAISAPYSHEWRWLSQGVAAADTRNGSRTHFWSLREVLMFRVPPWPQQQPV